MAINMETAMLMVKQRKDMMPGISQRDDYIEMRIKAAIEGLANDGIHLVDNAADLMFLVDCVVWQYNNRDKPGAPPEWLTESRRIRWMNDRKINEDYKAMLEEVDGYDP